ncbi:MAG: hypothetical protein R2849_10890 [Thermomicrobiales bacterium]
MPEPETGGGCLFDRQGMAVFSSPSMTRLRSQPRSAVTINPTYIFSIAKIWYEFQIR